MATVELKNIYKIYEGSEKPAVCNANFKVEDKEFVVLVGPSGCGKSTILRMIAGLESITKGELYIDNVLVNNLPPKDRDIAMVFQNYALYPHMSVYDNMAFGLKIRKIPKDEIDRRVKEAAKILHLENYLNRKPKALSGGQRQRVAVGRAIVRNPKVFLFDEPLSNLDAKLRVQMRAEIISLHQKLEATMIYVTHDQIEAMTMGDKIVVINEGIIQQIGSPLELYNNPINKFVAGFIGSPPMNFIEVLVKYNSEIIELINGNFIIEIKDEYKINLLKKYNNRKLILGIRPEDIHDDKKSNLYKINANVEIIEPLGADTYVHFIVDNVTFLATFRSNTTAHHGEKNRTVYFDLNKIYFFDPENDFINIYKI